MAKEVQNISYEIQSINKYPNDTTMDRKPRVVKFQTRTYPHISWSTNEEIPREIRHHIKGNLSITYTPEYLDDLENKVTYGLSDDDKEVRLMDPGGHRVEPSEIKTEIIRMPDLVVTGREEAKDMNILDEKTELFEDIMENHPDNWDNPERLDYEQEYDEEENLKATAPNTSKPKMECHIRLETPRTVDFKRGSSRKIKSSTPRVEEKECMNELNEVFANDSGSANEDTTFEKEFKNEVTNQIEQTLEVTQPEGITRPTARREVILVSEMLGVEDDEENGVEVYDDGGRRFERTSESGYLIRRPKGGFEIKRKRMESARHQTNRCRIGGTIKMNRTLDRDDSKNSVFCTPATQIKSLESKKDKPTISRMAGRHRSNSDHTDGMRRAVKRESDRSPEYEDVTSGEEGTHETEKRSWISTQKRTSIKSRLNYTNGFKIPKVEFTTAEAQETQEEDFEHSKGFAALTTEELLLIAGSSDHVQRLGRIQNGVQDEYREVVIKLIRRVGILSKKNMDPLQRKIFKKLAGDFSRQVLPRPPGYTPGKDTEHREA